MLKNIKRIRTTILCSQTACCARTIEWVPSSIAKRKRFTNLKGPKLRSRDVVMTQTFYCFYCLGAAAGGRIQLICTRRPPIIWACFGSFREIRSFLLRTAILGRSAFVKFTFLVILTAFCTDVILQVVDALWMSLQLLDERLEGCSCSTKLESDGG